MTTNIYIRGVKELNWTTFNGKLWQRNYYEHIIQDGDDYDRIATMTLISVESCNKFSALFVHRVLITAMHTHIVIIYCFIFMGYKYPFNPYYAYCPYEECQSVLSKLQLKHIPKISYITGHHEIAHTVQKGVQLVRPDLGISNFVYTQFFIEYCRFRSVYQFL